MLMLAAVLLLSNVLDTRSAVYDEHANARTEIKRMLECAHEERKPLLLTFGANWCTWCRQLHHLLSADRELASVIDGNYLRLNIDVGEFDKNIDVAREHGVVGLEDTGIPILVVLRPDGGILAVKDSNDFVVGPRYSRAMVLRFLRQHASGGRTKSP